MGLIQVDAKMRIKRSTIATTVPTLGNNDDHTDGSWSDEDIYTGEFFFNVPDKKLWIGGDSAPEELAFKSDIVGSQDLGSSNLVSSDQVRLFQLWGNTINDNLTITNASGQFVARFKGDRFTDFRGLRIDGGSSFSYLYFLSGGNTGSLQMGNTGQLDLTAPLRYIVRANGNLVFQATSGGDFQLYEGVNFNSGTTTGTKINDAPTRKLAFWGKNPITQPTTAHAAAVHAAIGGGNVQLNDTFDGYTIQQIVKALIDVGILQ